MTPWLRFLMRRLIGLCAIMAALAVATFMLVRLIPGDPALAVVGPDASPEQLAVVRHQLGVDQPLTAQLYKDFTRLPQGDLGTSFITGQPVAELIQQRLPSSLTLASAALAFILILAVPFGMLAGGITRENRHPRAELAFIGITSILGALPQYLAATFLAFIFAVWLRALPVAGSDPPLQSLILPLVSVALAPTAALARIVRVETLNVLAQDYIRTARSKRLSERLIYIRHAVPNVLTATLTVSGVIFSSLVGGTVIVENIFARNGLGTALVAAVLSRDYPVIQGVVLILGIVVVIVNAVVEILLGILDPRSLAGVERE